ncbi:BON domain-containing protein [Ferruginibacter sp.]|uniref:BON domain-containing protein n=1 Tax=Ferruginibacter sp. TaxID=1940288 RepID=UPI0019C0EB05|nr:BON domain-containing protein [Ferruginibacter sp.]MBC7628647.1 BON domain-containing protein [Ferruginibacter sp.]
MSKIKPLLAIAILLITAISCNNKPEDKQIQENVTKKLQDNKNYAGVTANVKEGTVTLAGTCEGDNCAVDIENNIKGVDGVKKVENNIIKDNSIDMTMRTSVQSIITKYPGVQADVAAGVIVLRGNINRDNLQFLMSDLSILYPQKIGNQLVVK